MKAIVNGKLVFPERVIEGNILIEADRIVAAGQIDVPDDAEIINANGLFVGPGLIDQHSHGYQQTYESHSAKTEPKEAALGHLKHGTTSYVPSSSYSESMEKHLKMIERCKDAIDNDPDTSIVGIHLEGPFINKGYGSFTDNTMNYSDEAAETLYSAAEGYALQCTYAPENPYAPKVEACLRKHHILPAIGHSDASPKDVERAVACGAKVLTHTFDATGNFMGLEQSAKLTQHPQQCLSDVCLSIPGLYYELICDQNGFHVTKTNINLAYRAAGEDHIILITDAVVEPSDGMGKNLIPGADVSYDFRGVLTGSRLTLARAVRNFRKATGADVRVAFKCASTNPAKAMGIYDKYGSIEAGKVANIIFVDDEFHVKKIIFKGKELSEVRD